MQWQSKTRVLTGLEEFLIDVQMQERRNEPQSSARANHHYEDLGIYLLNIMFIGR